MVPINSADINSEKIESIQISIIKLKDFLGSK